MSKPIALYQDKDYLSKAIILKLGWENSKLKVQNDKVPQRKSGIVLYIYYLFDSINHF